MISVLPMNYYRTRWWVTARLRTTRIWESIREPAVLSPVRYPQLEVKHNEGSRRASVVRMHDLCTASLRFKSQWWSREGHSALIPPLCFDKLSWLTTNHLTQNVDRKHDYVIGLRFLNSIQLKRIGVKKRITVCPWWPVWDCFSDVCDIGMETARECHGGLSLFPTILPSTELILTPSCKILGTLGYRTCLHEKS